MLKIYNTESLLAHTNPRKGELKFGEVAGTVESLEELKSRPETYVLFGIPEDIGVRANSGKPGASEAWTAALNSLCNLQHTTYCPANKVIVLGEIDCSQQMQQANALDTQDPHYVEKLGELVTQIDHLVAQVVAQLVAQQKVPIIIGGGHNNSLGNLKGASTAVGSPVHCINFDAHTDLRTLEHRHSGNGFSYAAEAGYLNKYFIFGLHRNYTSQQVFDTMLEVQETVQFSFFEDISILHNKSFSEALTEAEVYCSRQPFGLEIDMDAIANMGSSAMTPSGFSLEECRQFIHHFSTKNTCRYIHICEGAPNRELFAGQVGKAIAYLISDVIS